MKTFNIIIGTATVLLLISTAICGFWIRANNVTDISSTNFHMTIGSISVAFGALSVMFLLRLLLKR